MKLNANFDSTLEEIIKLYAPLMDWFARNQEIMAYFEMTHKGCLQFNHNPMASQDVIVLGKMANAALTWLETPKTIPILLEEKAVLAAAAIAKVYEAEKEKLSEEAKIQYYIDVPELQNDETKEISSERQM